MYYGPVNRQAFLEFWVSSYILLSSVVMCLAWLQALGPAKAIARPTFLAWLKISKAQARPPGPGLCIKCINLDSNFVSPIIIQLAQWPESRTVPVSHKNKLYSSPTLVLSLLHVYHATIITLPLNPWHKTVASKFKFFSFFAVICASPLFLISFTFLNLWTTTIRS